MTNVSEMKNALNKKCHRELYRFLAPGRNRIRNRVPSTEYFLSNFARKIRIVRFGRPSYALFTRLYQI